MVGFFQIFKDPLLKQDPNAAGITLVDTASTDARPKFDHVRRPVRGMVLKPETFTTLQVKTKEGKNLLLLDAGGSIEKNTTSFTDKYSNFLIQSVSEQSQEKSQILETFGSSSYVFFFGKRPTVLNISGILCNSADFNWKDEWWQNYETYLRGTRCTENSTYVEMSYEDLIIGGYIMSCSTDENADPSELIQFNFQFLVSFKLNIGQIGENSFPYFTPVNIEPEVVVIANSDIPPQAANTDNPELGFFYNYVQKALQGDINLNFLYGSRAQTYTTYITNYISGANMRIPVGFAGSTVFDNTQAVKLTYGTTQGVKTTEVKYGKIRDNADEYVANIKSSATAKTVYINAPSTLAIQYAEGKKQEDIAKAEFAKYGINTDPPSKLKQLIAEGAFASVKLAGNLARAKLDPTDEVSQGLITAEIGKGISNRER